MKASTIILIFMLLTWNLIFAAPEVADATIHVTALSQRLLFQFSAPPHHHFNQKAPNQLVHLRSGKVHRPTLEKNGNLLFSIPRKPKTKTQEPFTADVYICNNPQTYCAKQTLSFSWNEAQETFTRVLKTNKTKEEPRQETP